MKRKLVTFFAMLLSLVVALSASGCSSITFLSFNNNFAGGVDHSVVPQTLTETLTYEVNYAEKYHTSYIKKGDSIDQSILKFEFGTGTYVQTLTISPRLPEGITTTLEDASGNRIYCLKSTLSIPVKYAVNGASLESVEFTTDTIESEVYFLAANLSFAPIYSSTKSSITFSNVQENTAAVKAIKVQTTTKYSQTEYVTTTKVDDEAATTTTYKYDYKTAIDNNQLLFALRNATLSTELYSTLPVISYSYGAAKDLHVRLHESLKESFKIDYTVNGTTATQDGEVEYNHVSFILGASTNTGSPKYLKIQKSKTANLPYRALVLQYAEPITTYGTFETLGALVYTLKSVEIA